VPPAIPTNALAIFDEPLRSVPHRTVLSGSTASLYLPRLPPRPAGAHPTTGRSSVPRSGELTPEPPEGRRPWPPPSLLQAGKLPPEAKMNYAVCERNHLRSKLPLASPPRLCPRCNLVAMQMPTPTLPAILRAADIAAGRPAPQRHGRSSASHGAATAGVWRRVAPPGPGRSSSPRGVATQARTAWPPGGGARQGGPRQHGHGWRRRRAPSRSTARRGDSCCRDDIAKIYIFLGCFTLKSETCLRPVWHSLASLAKLFIS
jgi:hypothetical protein